jgi:hypothetical protein
VLYSGADGTVSRAIPLKPARVQRMRNLRKAVKANSEIDNDAKHVARLNCGQNPYALSRYKYLRCAAIQFSLVEYLPGRQAGRNYIDKQ